MKHLSELLTYFGREYVVNHKIYVLQGVMPVSRDAVLSTGENRIIIPYGQFNFDSYVKEN